MIVCNVSCKVNLEPNLIKLYCSKMFVGGHSQDRITKKLQEYFRKFEEFQDCTIMKHSKINKSRNSNLYFLLIKSPLIRFTMILNYFLNTCLKTV